MQKKVSSTVKGIFAVLVFNIANLAWAHDEASQAEYLGNEGVLVSHGDTAVLFDAFYTMSFDQYLLVAPATQAAMLEGKPPFDQVRAVFVSHIHGDHFSPEPARAFLMSHPQVKLFGPGQVIDALTKNSSDLSSDQLIRFDLKPGDTAVTSKVERLGIAVAAIPHSGGQRMAHIQNLAFRVSVDDGATVLHLGDAGADTELFAGLQSFFETVDAVFTPFWFYRSQAGQRILEDIIGAEMTIGIHVPAAAQGKGDTWREEAGGDLFTDPGERRTLR